MNSISPIPTDKSAPSPDSSNGAKSLEKSQGEQVINKKKLKNNQDSLLRYIFSKKYNMTTQMNPKCFI